MPFPRGRRAGSADAASARAWARTKSSRSRRARRGTPHGDVGVVDEEDRFEAPLLRRACDLVGADREVVLEGDYAVIHGSLTSTRREPRRVGLVRTLRRPLRRPFAALAFCQPCI